VWIHGLKSVIVKFECKRASVGDRLGYLQGMSDRLAKWGMLKHNAN